MAPQDFIKGWPHTDLLSYPELRAALTESFAKGMERSQETLNYGDAANGAYMLGHPDFRKGLASTLERLYERPVDWKTLMSTSGSSQGTDISLRIHCKAGDLAVVEEPTYYLSFTMIRDRGMDLVGVPLSEDGTGMDLDALQARLQEFPGKIKVVYTVPIHHNPTGVTMPNAKRERLVAMAREHGFVIIADEAYQLLSYEKMEEKPLFYHDDPNNPRVLSIGTFSKLIGPGVKVGWIQAHEQLLKPLTGIGFIDSGNNPVIFSSMNLLHFLESGSFEKHLAYVCKECGEKKTLMVKKLQELGLEPNDPKGGYFVWCKKKNKVVGRTGEGMCIAKDRFHDIMRICFCWLSREQIEEGLEELRE